jgi:hypothetical protein
MASIKCIGCYELLREKITLGGKDLTVYNCHRFFPYACALSGLLRPGSGIVEAAKDCPQRIEEHCILCQKPPTSSYGDPPIVYTCKEHDAAWGKWLEEHPERRAYLAPMGRARKANWVVVFREFIEDMRVKAEEERLR